VAEKFHKGHMELRLALVMNGGVSLAVWMGGVAHEIDLLRRASQDGPAGDPSPVYRFWRDLCDRHGSSSTSSRGPAPAG
jgi:hypothetical protein